MADFFDNKAAEDIIEEAIDFVNTLKKDSSHSILMMRLRIAKAYSVYKAERLENAEELYNQLLTDLKTTLTHSDQLSDCLYYCGCLLLELGGDERKSHAFKLWDEAIEIISNELTRMEREKAPQFFMFQLKLRLYRLFCAKTEKFPELPLVTVEESLAKSLLIELEPQLGNPMSWDRQLWEARGPLHLALPAPLLFKNLSD
jgi:hypothetical protein